MREIKFRAWDGDKMHYPHACEVGKNHWNGETAIVFQPGNLGGGYITSSYVMQFTGLLDKNGKEIWEGDIVKAWIDFGPGGERQHMFVVKITPFGVNIQKWNYTEGECFLPEVIGNIYEDPELLEKAGENG